MVCWLSHLLIINLRLLQRYWYCKPKELQCFVYSLCWVSWKLVSQGIWNILNSARQTDLCLHYISNDHKAIIQVVIDNALLASQMRSQVNLGFLIVYFKSCSWVTNWRGTLDIKINMFHAVLWEIFFTFTESNIRHLNNLLPIWPKGLFSTLIHYRNDCLCHLLCISLNFYIFFHKTNTSYSMFFVITPSALKQ